MDGSLNASSCFCDGSETIVVAFCFDSILLVPNFRIGLDSVHYRRTQQPQQHQQQQQQQLIMHRLQRMVLSAVVVHQIDHYHQLRTMMIKLVTEH